jgi:serine protease inhibitor ecotin
MAIVLAAINRRLLIDSSDLVLDRVAGQFLADKGLDSEVSSIVLDDDRSILFVRVNRGQASESAVESHALGEALKAFALAHEGKTVDAVYWQFPSSAD